MSNVQDFIERIAKSVEHIYQYSSGFDITSNEFINTDSPMTADLGDKVFLFKPDEDRTSLVRPYEIVGFGKKLIKVNGKKTTTPTYSLSGSYGIIELTEEEFVKQAVSPKEYYARLAQHIRETEVTKLLADVEDRLQKIELTLDKIYFDQECAINEFKLEQAHEHDSDPSDNNDNCQEISW